MQVHKHGVDIKGMDQEQVTPVTKCYVGGCNYYPARCPVPQDLHNEPAIANEQAAGIPKEVSTEQEPTGHANAAGGIKIKVQRIKEEAGAVSSKPAKKCAKKRRHLLQQVKEKGQGMDFRDKANKDEKSTTCNCIHSHVKSRELNPLPQLYRKSRAAVTASWHWQLGPGIGLRLSR